MYSALWISSDDEWYFMYEIDGGDFFNIWEFLWGTMEFAGIGFIECNLSCIGANEQMLGIGIEVDDGDDWILDFELPQEFTFSKLII